MTGEERAQIVGVAGENVGTCGDRLRGNERIHGVGSSRPAEQCAGEAGGRLLGREDIDRVSNTVEGGVPRAAAQSFSQYGNRNPDVKGELERAGQQGTGARVTAGPGDDGSRVEDQALRRRLRLAT